PAGAEARNLLRFWRQQSYVFGALPTPKHGAEYGRVGGARWGKGDGYESCDPDRVRGAARRRGGATGAARSLRRPRARRRERRVPLRRHGVERWIGDAGADGPRPRGLGNGARDRIRRVARACRRPRDRFLRAGVWQLLLLPARP